MLTAVSSSCGRSWCGGEAGEGMGRAEGISKAHPGRDAETAEAPGDVVKQGRLAVEKVRDARAVDPDTVRTVGMPRRAVAPEPAGEAGERRPVSRKLGRRRDEIRQRGPGIGEGGAGNYVGFERPGISRGDAEAVRPRLNQRERLAGRNPPRRLPLEALDRPGRQPNGNDARHHTTP